MIDLQLLGGLAVVGPESLSVAPGRRRRDFGLLALVAAAGPQPIAREKILGFLWPESDDERARNSLRQTVFSLRRELREDLFLPESAAGIALDPAHLTVDLWAFRTALSRKAPADAVRAYRGPFLDGFSIPGRPDFSHWIEAERQQLERQYIEALETLARGAMEAGRYDEAVSWHRRHAAVDQLSARATLGLLRALAEAGDREGALHQANIYERLVRERLEADPDPTVTEFVASLRSGAAVESRRPTPPGSDSGVRLRGQTPGSDSQVRLQGQTPAVVAAPSFDRRIALVAAVVLLTIGAVLGRLSYVQHTDAAAVGADDLTSTIRILASGAKNISGRDPTTRLVACDGPACPPGVLPQDAFIVPKHGAHAPPVAGTSYIAPVPDGTTMQAPGYTCCTTATFESVFSLPKNAVAATIVVSIHADNRAAVGVNGVEFGQQPEKWDAGNYTDVPETYRKTFSPDPSGTNRLHLTLWDGGGALALHYSAIVTYEVAADDDRDGVPNDGDPFPASDLRPTVVVGPCNADVTNRSLREPAGATFNDLIAQALNAPRDSVRADTVSMLVEGWKRARWISDADAKRIAACTQGGK
jgi:DNA-binding SARP family transcriptional activator